MAPLRGAFVVFVVVLLIMIILLYISDVALERLMFPFLDRRIPYHCVRRFHRHTYSQTPLFQSSTGHENKFNLIAGF